VEQVSVVHDHELLMAGRAPDQAPTAKCVARPTTAWCSAHWLLYILFLDVVCSAGFVPVATACHPSRCMYNALPVKLD
jgi:hypothetical protein